MAEKVLAVLVPAFLEARLFSSCEKFLERVQPSSLPLVALSCEELELAEKISAADFEVQLALVHPSSSSK